MIEGIFWFLREPIYWTIAIGGTGYALWESWQRIKPKDEK